MAVGRWTGEGVVADPGEAARAVAVKIVGRDDPCSRRDRWLVASEMKKAFGNPATRRLIVEGAGHYVDRSHGHVAEQPRGVLATRLFVCTHGSAWLQAGGLRRPVRSGDAFLIPAGLPHSYGPDAGPWSFWWCSLVGTDAGDVFRAVAGRSGPVIRLQDPYRIASVIDEITSIYERSPAETTALEASAAAWKLVARLGVDQARSGADPLTAVMDYLSAHVDEWVTVPELASQVGMTAARLNYRFRAATGGGVLAYQVSLRMTKARQLLGETEASVAEIAREVGYSDPDYFSRHFRRTNGVSPSEFRQQGGYIG